MHQDLTATDAIGKARAALAALGVPSANGLGPVRLGRELLLQADQLAAGGQTDRLASMIVTANAVFMAAVARPDPREYEYVGDEYGRADAMMWCGLCSALLVDSDGPVAARQGRPRVLADVNDVLALDLAAVAFRRLGEAEKAGRCAEELAEVVRREGRHSDAARLFQIAAQFYLEGQSQDRADSALQRMTDSREFSAPFFRTHDGSAYAYTLSGSVQYGRLRRIARQPRPGRS